MRKIYLLLACLIAISTSSLAQVGQGAIQGKIVDKETGEPLPFANVSVEENGNPAGGSTTDFDGKYSIKPLSPGVYTLKASYVGYQTIQINNVKVSSNEVTFVSPTMSSEGGVTLDEVVVAEFSEPLIKKDDNTQGGKIGAEQFKRLPTRSVAEAQAIVPGVVGDPNGGTSIRGSRGTGNQTFIDGIKVRGGSNLPRAAVEEIQVLTGGIPAEVGDITGGATFVTTKGATTASFGALELLSSGFGYKDGNTQKTWGLDNQGYNLVGFTYGGPIWRKKDEEGRKKDAIVSFIVTSEFISIVDTRPSSVGTYKLTEDKLNELKSQPYMRPEELGGQAGLTGSVLRSEYTVRSGDMEIVDTRQNASLRDINLQTNFAINTSKNTTLKVGGTFFNRRADNWSRAGSLYNFENNPFTTSTDWRVYGRFTQRFANPIDEEGNETQSTLKNAYVSIQVDYQQNLFSAQNPDHEDEFFKYGYVGRFESEIERSYTPGFDQELGQVAFIQDGFNQTAWNYTYSDINPDLASYTRQYYDLHKNPDGTPIVEGFYDNRNNVETNTIINGGGAPSVYNMWTGHGNNSQAYTQLNNNQFRLTASGAADLKSHEIKIGFEFEQRVDRGYGMTRPQQLWNIGRQQMNFHLQQIDSNSRSVEFINGVPYVSYERFYRNTTDSRLGDEQFVFDYNVRRALGFAPDGNDFIDFDAYDPTAFKIDYFSADDLINNNSLLQLSYYGYDYTGKRQSGSPTLDDFFTQTDEFGKFTRPIDAFRPIYAAGYIQDKFTFDDLIFRVGLRVDYFDANQPVLKDPYSLFPTVSAGEVRSAGVGAPSNIGSDYVVYVNEDRSEIGNLLNDEVTVIGYRNPEDNTWYGADGTLLANARELTGGSGNPFPLLQDGTRVAPETDLNSDAFEDYTPQIVPMPRISFSFPISDEASFFANYDVLVSRPTSGLQFRPTDYLFIGNTTLPINNPDLKPERTVTYEIGFKQALTKNTAVSLSAFYREMRDQIQVFKFDGAYPRTYTSFSNIDFGTVTGFTIAYDLRRIKNIALTANYTLQFAQGTGSSSGSQLQLVQADRPNLRNIAPLSYDQRHNFNLNFDFHYGYGKDYRGPKIKNKDILSNAGFNFIARLNSGRPYTKWQNVQSQVIFNNPRGFLEGDINGSRLPWTFNIDFRVDKRFQVKYGSKAKDNRKFAWMEVYLQALNLLNTANVIGVWNSTGSPDDDGYLTNAQSQPTINAAVNSASYIDHYTAAILNPGFYSTQRRLRLGLVVEFLIMYAKRNAMKLMKAFATISLLLIATGSMAISEHALQKHKNKNDKTHKAPRSAAECAPATAVTFLNFNNVNALIETGGSMWQDRPNSAPAYEVPSESGKTSIYSGSLWMGGTDANDQLKIAAVTFRNGTNDFWTGPLSRGTAEIDPKTCRDYDRFWHITRQEVVEFIEWFNCTKLGQEGCTRDFSSYVIPKVILEWPAHGDETLDQDFYLAPFFDRDGDGLYDPEGSGDYPYYDLFNDIDCRAVRDIRLFGDDTYWWVFNDKGNIHTETNGQSIGMEIRAQAFAFATNDEVDNMTFYNYELINRSTFTLFNTYFGQWVDPDVGCANDDYVGCDVQRGLGYAYNGDQDDEDCNGAFGYGDRPAAMGIDFFEGPYQDNDSINNLVGIGFNEALNGIGYKDESLPPDQQDSIIDNERYGMRRFVFYNRGGGQLGDPTLALQHYNYLRSIWRDGSKMVFGGNGYPGGPGTTDIEADFMFPGDSDPLNWGTRGVDPGQSWTEITAGNAPFDRRFIQSAGPFTLTPGAVNDITVGVVWAQAVSGGNEASRDQVILADTKAQALFDNCFDVLDGPDAPDLDGIELNKEIVLMISNRKGVSNNFQNYPGDYVEADPFIITPDDEPEPYDNEYRFQGYQIYQVADATVSVSDLKDLDKARLAFQCDIEDDVADLVNFEFSEELNASVPVIEVANAANAGISTSFRVTEDLFAEDDPRLVNFKTYYFIAIAYAYNNYKTYVQDDAEGADGQKLPYLSSRKSASGSIQSFAFTPHPTQPKNGGTRLNANYGDEPQITRIEGRGNGGNSLAFTPATLAELLDNSSTPSANMPTYEAGRGPISVKVVDPTNVYDGEFFLQTYVNDSNQLDWKMWRVGDGPDDLNDTVLSASPITRDDEQIIPKWGISVDFVDINNPGEQLCGFGISPPTTYRNGFIDASIEFKDSSRIWLTGVEDITGADDQNWIRCGVAADGQSPASLYNSYERSCDEGPDASVFEDPQCIYNKLVDGWWSPYRLVSYTETADGVTVRNAPSAGLFAPGLSVGKARLEDLSSVQIVITDSVELWTRCPVIEMQEEAALAVGGAAKGLLRQSPSVDINGTPSSDPSDVGMGWFPGYAINLETGERLNMAFGEDSWLADQNGADMLWNPTSTFEEGFIPNDPQRRQEKKWGGKHYIYVFGNTDYYNDGFTGTLDMPSYDQGQTLKNALEAGGSAAAEAMATCMWVGIPLLAENRQLFETDVTISLRVTKSYETYTSDSLANNGLPMYKWNMNNLSTEKNLGSVASDVLAMINVVPNPYYAFAEHYEQTQLENRVKIINLPQTCKVSIYNVSGTLIRVYNKSDPGTEVVWDLKNQSDVPIAGGVYLIHVDAPGVGERIVKWFGVLRPADLQGF